MKSFSKRLLALLLVVTMVMQGGISVRAAEWKESDEVSSEIQDEDKMEENSVIEDTTQASEETTESHSTTEELSTEVVADTNESTKLLTTKESVSYSVKYDAHVQKNGWMDVVSDGQKAGTSGECKRVEAMHIWIEKNTKNADGSVITEKLQNAIRYKAHVQKNGWMKEASDGEMVGTSGESKRMEAIQMSLQGGVAELYDIYYRVHVQSYGWLDWAKNGEVAGSSGYGKRMEAIQIVLVQKGSGAPGTTTRPYVCLSNKGMVTYQAHCQSKGWMDSVADGQPAGTTGLSKRMEALKIWLNNPTDSNGNLINGSIEYSGHVQSIGWQNWVSSGEIAGTEGQAKRLEAIKIRLKGDMANVYDVYYRVHSATYGTLGWAKNGEIAGSEGCSKSIESIEIKLVKKGETISENQERSYVSKNLIGQLTAQGYVQRIGWQQPVTNGGKIGTSGKGLRLEAAKISIDTSGDYYKGNIYCAMYQQGSGWQAAVANGDIAGTIGQSKRAEAIKIFLSDELEKYCDVWYRAQVQGWGWLGWAKNGQEAGTKGISSRLETVQIVITPKGANAPGTNRNYMKTVRKNTGDLGLYGSIANRSSNTEYIIAVDTNKCLVGIYKGSKGQWTQVQQYLCGPGKLSSPTVKGEYQVYGRGLAFGQGYTCWYYTQFYGDYLFHSILYQPGSKTVIQESGLGKLSSHGCVRLSIENAKWIYDNIPNGTKVYVY